MDRALSFDDVLITPGFGIVESRDNVSLKTRFLGYDFELPIISANMSTVTEYEMACAMYHAGGLPILHRMCSIEEQCKLVKDLAFNLQVSRRPIAASIEAKENEGIERAYKLISSGCNILCVDVAYAYSQPVFNFLKVFFNKFPNDPVIIGNIANQKSSIYLHDYIKNTLKVKHDNIAFKVGVGGGAMCTTRIVTGCGMPTLASLLDINKSYTISYPIIADGGIKNSGDCVKAFVAGADMVMIGSLLAGTAEAPGNVIKYKGQKRKGRNSNKKRVSIR